VQRKEAHLASDQQATASLQASAKESVDAAARERDAAVAALDVSATARHCCHKLYMWSWTPSAMLFEFLTENCTPEHCGWRAPAAQAHGVDISCALLSGRHSGAHKGARSGGGGVGGGRARAADAAGGGGARRGGGGASRRARGGRAQGRHLSGARCELRTFLVPLSSLIGTVLHSVTDASSGLPHVADAVQCSTFTPLWHAAPHSLALG